MLDAREALTFAAAADRLVLDSRLKDIALLAYSDMSERVRSLASVFAVLPPGGYLVGCGPYCCGILPITVDEVVIGRPPSPLEAIPAQVVDYSLNDAVLMVPREASRVHATVLRRAEHGEVSYGIRDEQSTTGTFVNAQRVPGEAVSNPTAFHPLSSGDVITLGPSGINAYLFIKVPGNTCA